MHCREAQYRLTQLASDPNGRVDVELMEHLDQCPICAREAQTEALLSRALQETSAETDRSLPTLAITRTAVVKAVPPSGCRGRKRPGANRRWARKHGATSAPISLLCGGVVSVGNGNRRLGCRVR